MARFGAQLARACPSKAIAGVELREGFTCRSLPTDIDVELIWWSRRSIAHILLPELRAWDNILDARHSAQLRGCSVFDRMGIDS